MTDRPVSRITIRGSNNRYLVYTLVYTQLNGLDTRPVTCNFSRICASEPGVYFAVCTGPTSNHFLDNTRDTHCAKNLAPRTSAFALVFPKYIFYVPNPCILGTRPVLPCKSSSCCKLELVGTKSVFVLCYSGYLSVVGCSQVELSYQ